MHGTNTSFTLHAARVITPDKVLAPGWVRIERATIADIGEGESGADGAIDLGDVTLGPGFADVHVHGGGGHSLTTGEPPEVRAYAEWAPTTGVTSFLATVVARDVEEGLQFVRAIAEADPSAGAELLGVNLEGPFLNPGRKGAIPESWIVTPDVATFERLVDASRGMLRVMTVAPEVGGASELISAAVEDGMTVSVGHTDAQYDVAIEAFRAGARHVTHAFNAMRVFHHRDPGPIGAALDSDGVTVEAIADGVHVHPSAIRMLVSAFGPERVALVTDGTPMAGGGDGSFRIGGATADVRNGRATLANGTIAGSVATMDEMVRNVVSWGVCDLADSVRMASTVPAEVAGVGERKGRLAPGYDADVVALDGDLRVAGVWARGESAYDVKKQ